MRRSWLRLFWAGVVVIGVAVGYLVSSGLGENLLHDEIETQLSRLLQGSVEIGHVDLNWDEGLQLEARSLAAYPHPEPESGAPPALRAGRILAHVDLFGLLIGRVELSDLMLEGAQVRVEREIDGSLVGFPIPAWTQNETPPDPNLEVAFAENLAVQIEALDAAASAWVGDLKLANEIEIIDGTVIWIDHFRKPPEAEPTTIRLELVQIVARKDWLSDATALEAEAVFVDGEHAPFPIELEINRKDGEGFDWILSLAQIPLKAAETPLSFIDGITGLDGTLNAVLRLRSTSKTKRRLSLAGQIDNATIALRKSRKIIEGERVEFGAGLEIGSRQIRIAGGKLEAERLQFEFQGNIARPIRPNSRAQLESRILGLHLADLSSFARTLAGDSAAADGLSRMTDRIETGQIRYVQAKGTARLREWQNLATGRSSDLPEGFVLGGAFDGIRVRTGERDAIEDLSGEIEWVGDEVSLRNATARYRGEALPQVDIDLEGVAELFRAGAQEQVFRNTPPPVPGFGPLLEIFKPRDPTALPPVKAIGLAIDYLENPVLYWPIHDLRLYVEPLRRGLQVGVREGVWGGATVEGEIVWFNDPTSPTVSAHLKLGPQNTPSTSAMASQKAPAGRWGEGRFELDFRPQPTLPFENAVGFFRLEGNELRANDVEIRVAPEGQLAARGVIGLDAPDSIDLDLSFAVTEARLEKIAGFIRIPDTLATGDFQATGTLIGRVRPDVSFIADLEGSLRATTLNGRVKTNVPLFLRLAKASEGYNPFSDQDELKFERMQATIGFKDGVLNSENFEIEGPLRVFANARIDTNQSPGDIRAVVGIFLFRAPNQIISSLPLVRSFLPGSKKGLIGAYFRVDGPLDKPDVDPLPIESLMSGVPDVIKAPFKVLRFLFEGSDKKNKKKGKK
ncbi:MAG: AsmA-like C-terminal region-containing protein [Myxococcota bacterium]